MTQSGTIKEIIHNKFVYRFGGGGGGGGGGFG